MSARFSNVGQRFGKLKVLQYCPPPRPKTKGTYYLCECDCGKQTIIKRESIVYDGKKHCGCESRFHGHSKGDKVSLTYGTWRTMVQRCTNQNMPCFKDYGGKGITVCERWKSFQNFLDDMGEKPGKLTLDRIDNKKGYGPDNCRWATRRRQRINQDRTKIYTVLGITGCLIELCEHFKMSIQTVYTRIHVQKLSPEEAFTRPLMNRPRTLK